MGDEIKYYKPMIIELNKMIFHIQKQIYYSDTRENPALQAFEGGIDHVIAYAFDRFGSHEKYLFRKFFIINVPPYWAKIKGFASTLTSSNHKNHKIKNE